MPVELFANDGLGLMTAGGNNAPASGTPQTWTVSVTNAFPAASNSAVPATQFYIADPLAETEKILVTNISGATWSVTRGADDTTPVTHALGCQIVQVAGKRSFWALAGIAPSGDTSGVTDSANIAAAFAGGAQRVRLQAGTFNVTQGQVVVGLGQWLRGAGMSSTTIKLVGGVAGPAVTVFSGTGSSRFLMAGVSDLTIDGTSGPANSAGLQAGDISEISLRDVAVQNFGGGTGVGFSFLNQNSWAEQLHGNIYAVNCDQCMLFSVSGTGSNSFQRMALDFWGEPNAGGWLCIMRNGVQFLNGRLAIRGNMQAAGGGVLFMQNTAVIGQSFQLDIGVENDATSGAGPQTINFSTASNTIDAYGQMQFLQIGGGTAWTPSNNNGNLNYKGTVYGDNTLQTKVRLFEWSSIVAGFPAGWTGQVSLRHNWDTGDVTLYWTFTIAATTVVAPGTAILAAAAIPSHFAPANTKSLPFTGLTGGGLAAGTSQGMQVSSAGGLNCQGAGFTVGGSSAFWTGQATYSNTL